jgi:hypothetical protein
LANRIPSMQMGLRIDKDGEHSNNIEESKDDWNDKVIMKGVNAGMSLDQNKEQAGAREFGFHTSGCNLIIIFIRMYLTRYVSSAACHPLCNF